MELRLLAEKARQSLFKSQGEVNQQREDLIAYIEANLMQKCELHSFFTIRWILA